MTGTPFDTLTRLLRAGGAVVLSGAGLSTESGIPDYRGPSGRHRQARPMTYQTFTGSAAARQRYWARSHLGWRHITGAVPNSGHRAVARLEKQGQVSAVITQNVDGLHQAAGAANVTELHGSLHRVTCLSCWQRTPRERLHERLAAVNPSWDSAYSIPHTRGRESVPASALVGQDPHTEDRIPYTAAGREPAVNPDGDVALEETAGFTTVDCESCGGILKPDVVFFGENVPKPRSEHCYDLVSGARSLIVLGSSLAVMSGLRYVRHAAARDIPVAIVNQGETRGDELASVKIEAPLGATLAEAVTAIAS